MVDVVKRYRAELEGRVRAHREVKGSTVDAATLYAQITERAPAAMLGHIGSAFENRWLETDPWPRRGSTRSWT